ncbi:DUF2271 domain-containing protein [Stagnimonas aquatica]|uniref:DUF2271 domain-containing protein n=1 Tax=Stagnimonas aquatica TaxID=2689987 RepID=A0A3N0VGR6_9GAMM|nr:DUF2271 domain-containing protein [Stagnimonas aquatica]ROH91895.1 DUF2271 domain-containing protein [Stagnimonas aquatica]
MRTPSLSPMTLALGGALLSAPAIAARLDLSVQIPQLEVAEYHRPYVAVWLERDDRSPVGTLALWYQQPKKGDKPAGEGPAGMAAGAEGGGKWLPDLRQWWRRGGRELSLPADGVSGATRPVGEHALSLVEGGAALKALPAGNYKLLVEAAREEGGRELLEIPFQWPAAAGQTLKAQGKSELGAVRLALSR